MTVVNNSTGSELWGPQRSRTVSWYDPGPGTARSLAMAGIDYLKAIIADELPPPPMAALMKFELVDAEPGKVVFTCNPDGSVYNPNGGLHGSLVLHAAGFRRRVGGAQHASRRQGVHVDRDQGELFEGGAVRHRPIDRHRDGREVGFAGGLYRRGRHRRVGQDGGDGYQHPAGVRPVASRRLRRLTAVAGLSPTTAVSLQSLVSRAGRRPARRGCPANAARSRPPGSARHGSRRSRNPSHRLPARCSG
jgi:hypothetical protein